MYYISAITQIVHTTQTCSVTRRNHAVNLATTSTAAELAETGYAGCKRCDADRDLTAAKAAAEPAPAAAKVMNCTECGFQFPRPQTRTTCQSQAACQKRQAARQTGLRGYQQEIAETIGTTDKATAELVETLMRTDRPTLDALTLGQFRRLARRSMRDARALAAIGELEPFCQAFGLQVPVLA